MGPLASCEYLRGHSNDSSKITFYQSATAEPPILEPPADEDPESDANMDSSGQASPAPIRASSRARPVTSYNEEVEEEADDDLIDPAIIRARPRDRPASRQSSSDLPDRLIFDDTPSQPRSGSIDYQDDDMMHYLDLDANDGLANSGDVDRVEYVMYSPILCMI